MVYKISLYNITASQILLPEENSYNLTWTSIIFIVKNVNSTINSRVIKSVICLCNNTQWITVYPVINLVKSKHSQSNQDFKNYSIWTSITLIQLPTRMLVENGTSILKWFGGSLSHIKNSIKNKNIQYSKHCSL